MHRVNTKSQKVYFISDAHLGSGPNHDLRQQTLIRFIGDLKENAGHLYILGDLFDFWFEYRHAIPKAHFKVLRALAELVESGTEVSYLGGNHDFWCGTYLSREVGLIVHQHPIVVTHQGRKLHLAHGDGIGPGDRGYRILKKILRHPWAIALYRTLHPDLGIPFAYKVSKTSRLHTNQREIVLNRLLTYLALPSFKAGNDAVVIGHIHEPIHITNPGGGDFLIIGDWLENFTYGCLEGGKLSIHRYMSDDQGAVIAPQTWPPDKSV